MRSRDKRVSLTELRHENQRLRAILDGITRAGVGIGALVEIRATRDTRLIQLCVCRADADEMAFVQDLKDEMQALAATMGGTIDPSKMVRTGVIEEPTAPKPGEP